MRFSSLISATALAATASAQQYPLNLVYQFDNAFSGVGYVNIENIAVRNNGKLLLNTVTGALMAQVDPANPQAELVANLTNALGNGQPGSLTGIAETCPDVYTVAAGNFRFGPSVPGGIEGVSGSFSVWNVDFHGKGGAKPSLVTTIPEAGTLNGVTAIPGGNKDLVLIADSILGSVWSVNTKTGEHKQVISSPLWLPSPAVRFGINGVHVQGQYLYFTNSATNSFGAVPINLQTGEAAGEVAVFVQGPNGTNFDDFSFKPNGGGAWVAAQENAVYQIPREQQPVLVAGGGEDSPLLGPTSTAFAKDGCTLYITTGGMGGPAPQSGQIFALNTCAQDKKLMKKWVA